MIVRLSNCLLRAALPSDEATETILNDLSEELRMRREGGRGWVHGIWYSWESLKLAAHFTLLRLDGRSRGPSRPAPAPSGNRRGTGDQRMGLESWIQDLRFAVRTFARDRVFTASAVLTLALGIGGSTAMFTVVDRVLLRPLPYEEPDRIVAIRQIIERWKEIANLRDSWDRARLHPDQFALFRDEATSLSAIAVHNQVKRVLRGEAPPELLSVGRASSGLLDLLGVVPARGRWFTREEEGDKNGPVPVVVLSDEFKRSHFPEAQEVLGTSIVLGDQAYTVIGVLPSGFHLREFAPGQVDDGHRDLWIPGGHECCYKWEAIGRLAPGVTIKQAEAQLQSYLPEIAPGTRRFRVIPLRQAEGEKLATPLILLLGATGLLLLIACGNVATLLMGQLAHREHELAARTALGASRARITRQLMTECALLGGMAVLVGVGLAHTLTPVMVRLGPTLPRLDDVGIDVRALAAGILAGGACVLISGLVPAMIASGDSLHSRLQRGSRSFLRRASRLSSFAVVLELALTTVLLVGGGLLTRSFEELMDIDPGIETEGLTALFTRLEFADAEDGLHEAFRKGEEIRLALESVPGVTAVTVSADLPFISKPWSTTIFLPGEVRGSTSLFWQVDHDYHTAMGIPLLSGRLLTAADREASASVAVISESLARANWPGRSPLGETFWLNPEDPPVSVIGVVGDVRHESLADRTEPVAYMPLDGRWGRLPRAFAIRSSRRPEELIPELRRAVLATAPGTLIEVLAPYERLVARSASVERFRMVLTTGFAVMAAILAGVGILGVTARAVASHRRELGIRMALGAREQRLVWEAVRRHLRLAGAGILLGVLLALGSSRLLAGFLFGITPADPVTFVSVTLGELGLALVTIYVPARRIAALEPATVLRPE